MLFPLHEMALMSSGCTPSAAYVAFVLGDSILACLAGECVKAFGSMGGSGPDDGFGNVYSLCTYIAREHFYYNCACTG